MKDVKTKRALGPLGRDGAHSAGPGNDCGHEAAIVLGPECSDRSRSRARLRVAQTKYVVSIEKKREKTTHPCAHNVFRCWLNGLVGKGGSREYRAHIRPFGLKGCALPLKKEPAHQHLLKNF